MKTIQKLSEKINITGEILYNVSMKDYTSFKVGGPADVVVRPASKNDLVNMAMFAKKENIPLFVLGEGANILVADAGIRGIVLDIRGLSSETFHSTSVCAECGTSISTLSLNAYKHSLSGLEFIYKMPGTLGGALYMNARCYGRSIADILESVEYLNEEGQVKTYEYQAEDWGYKISPFQNKAWILLEARLRLEAGVQADMWREMEDHASDREEKGHFQYPCAGSVFKNNRQWGKPSGVLIDECGLKGYRIEQAQVAEFHGNIIVNLGDAKASDIRQLVEYVQKTVMEQKGFLLEPEIVYVGDW